MSHAKPLTIEIERVTMPRIRVTLDGHFGEDYFDYESGPDWDLVGKIKTKHYAKKSRAISWAAWQLIFWGWENDLLPPSEKKERVVGGRPEHEDWVYRLMRYFTRYFVDGKHKSAQAGKR